MRGRGTGMTQTCPLATSSPARHSEVWVVTRGVTGVTLDCVWLGEPKGRLTSTGGGICETCTEEEGFLPSAGFRGAGTDEGLYHFPRHAVANYLQLGG